MLGNGLPIWILTSQSLPPKEWKFHLIALSRIVRQRKEARRNAKLEEIFQVGPHFGENFSFLKLLIKNRGQQKFWMDKTFLEIALLHFIGYILSKNKYLATSWKKLKK